MSSRTTHVTVRVASCATASATLRSSTRTLRCLDRVAAGSGSSGVENRRPQAGGERVDLEPSLASVWAYKTVRAMRAALDDR